MPSVAIGAAAGSGVGVGVGVGDGSGVGVGVGVGVGEGVGAGATMTPPEPLAPLPPSPPPQALTRNSKGRLTNADFFMYPRMLRAIILVQRCSKCRKHGKRPMPPNCGQNESLPLCLGIRQKGAAMLEANYPFAFQALFAFGATCFVAFGERFASEKMRPAQDGHRNALFLRVRTR